MKNIMKRLPAICASFLMFSMGVNAELPNLSMNEYDRNSDAIVLKADLINANGGEWNIQQGNITDIDLNNQANGMSYHYFLNSELNWHSGNEAEEAIYRLQMIERAQSIENSNMVSVGNANTQKTNTYHVNAQGGNYSLGESAPYDMINIHF